MPKRKETTIESLIAGGFIGAALGALLSKNKGSGAVLGAIAKAAITASMEAYEEAKETKLPLMVEEDDVLYEVRSDGTRKKIKNLPSSTIKLPKHFVLK